MKVAFSKRGRRSNLGPFIFVNRLAEHFEQHKEVQVVRASRYHDIHFMTIQGSGRRAEQYGAKKVLRIDGIYHDLSRDSHAHNAPIRDTYHGVDGVIFQSKFSRDMVYRHFGPPKKVKHEAIIYNGSHRYGGDGDECHDYGYPTVIAVARWRADKRLSSIVEGFLALNRDDVKLVIFGEVPEEQQVQHSRVQYYGTREPQRMLTYYPDARALLHLAYVDWCPNVVVEAIRCGVPVITTHNGGVPELIQRCGLVIKGDPDYDMEFKDFRRLPKVNPTMVAEALKIVLDAQRSAFMEERPDLSIEHCGEQYIKFFKKVLA